MLLLVVTDVSRGYLSRKLVCVSAEMRVHCVLSCGAPVGFLWSIICYTESGEKSAPFASEVLSPPASPELYQQLWNDSLSYVLPRGQMDSVSGAEMDLFSKAGKDIFS